MKKDFTWKDLHKWYEQVAPGRSKHALMRLLKGETVNLAEYPRVDYKKNHKGVGDFCYSMKKLLRDHKGVEIVGDIVRIPELQKPKNFLKNV